MGVQLTPGQRFLLDLLQRKLSKTILLYAKLNIERQALISDGQDPRRSHIEPELLRLRGKIKRLSARQKRFTSEVINGNGNNTIPKESFFEALGLVTRETLTKLNSKSNERRRRTTANPRFSHEAIQAKRALEPIQKRLEPRLSRNSRYNSDKEKEAAKSKDKDRGGDNNNNNHNNSNNTNSNNNTSTTSSKQDKDKERQAESIHRELVEQINILQQQINVKIGQIHEKRESNKKLEDQSESIRQRGLDMISALNKIYLNGTFREQGLQGALEHDNGNGQDLMREMLLHPCDLLLTCNESLDGFDID